MRALPPKVNTLPAVRRLIKWGSQCIFERDDALRDICNYDYQERETVNIIYKPCFYWKRGRK
jgi:hypothetical protein